MIAEGIAPTRFGDIHYLTGGEARDAIIFLHGWAGWPTLFRPLVNSLSRDFKIVAPYLPGHGKSFALRRDTSFSEIVIAMADFLENTRGKEGKIVLLGHSLGGSICWELARKKLKAGDKLVVVDPMLSYGGDSPIALVGSWFHDRVKDYWLGKRKWNPVSGILRSSCVQLAPSGLWNVIKTLRIDGEQLPKEIKVMVMWGKDDRLVPLSENRGIVDKYADNVEWHLFPGGHYWFCGQVGALMESLKAFVFAKI